MNKSSTNFAIGGAAFLMASAIVLAAAQARTRPGHKARRAAGAKQAAHAASASDSQALFAVQEAGKWGYINRAGRVAIAFGFSQAGPFRESRARACTEGGEFGSGKCGIINTHGQWILKPAQGSYSDFSGGLANVIIRESSEKDSPVFFHGFVDASGRRAFARPANAGSTDDFHEGLVLARLPYDQKGLYGYLDRRGKWAIAPKLSTEPPSHFTGDDREFGPRDFSHGLAVAQAPGDPAHAGFINAAGKFVIAPRFDGAGPFSEGLAEVQVLAPMEPGEGRIRTRSGFINLKGEMVIPARFQDASPFSNGLAIAEDEHFHWGYINARGDWAIKPRLGQSQIDDFSEEVAGQMAEDGQWGFIDKRGRWVIKPQFSKVDGFENGLASVEVPSNDKTRDDPEGGSEATIVSYDLTSGYINHAGRWVWKVTEHHEDHWGNPSSGTS